MLLMFGRFTIMSYVFGSISLLVAFYIFLIATKSKPQPIKKYVVLAIISFVFYVAMLSTLSSTSTIQPETEKSAINYNVVIEVHKDRIRVVDLSDNGKFDINISTASTADYYVNDIVDDAGNVLIIGQALEKAQAQIPSIGTAVSLPSA